MGIVAVCYTFTLNYKAVVTYRSLSVLWADYLATAGGAHKLRKKIMKAEDDEITR
jgi:hypothetical protein